MYKNKQKIAVIGAGVIGICNAKKLQDLGFEVTLFDEHGVAERCSKGNAGHFATEQVFPLACTSLLPKLPTMLLNPNSALRIDWCYIHKILPWFFRFICNMRSSTYRANTQALRALNESALDAFEELLSQEELDTLITKNGSLLTFETTKEHDIAATYRAFKAQGVAVQWLKGDKLFELEPRLNKSIKNALLFNDVGHTANPHKLCLHIFNQFMHNEGAFIKKAVKSITPSEQSVELITCDNQKYEYDKIVISTGAWSKPLATQLGYNIPLDTERGYHAMLDEHNVLSRPVASAERQFIITPMQKGLRLAGTVEFAGIDAPERTQRATMLVKHAKHLINNLKTQTINETWMGCRPSLPDSLPVIGQAPKNKNVFFAFGHQHLGLTQSAITAKLIGQLCQGEKPCLDLTPYRIDRF